MRIVLQLTVGTCLIILAGGTINYIHDDPTFGGSLILTAAWVAMATIIIVTLAFTFIPEFNEVGKRWIKNDQSKELKKQVKELEKRLIDLQDIVITNDDKLERLESKSLATPSPPPQTISD